MVFAGWLINHFLSIKSFADSTPGLNFWNSFKGYFQNDPWGFMVSGIFLFVTAFFISLGMSDFLSKILGIPIEYQGEGAKFFVAFLLGMQIQRIIKIFTKQNPIDMRTLPEPVKEKVLDKEELT